MYTNNHQQNMQILSGELKKLATELKYLGSRYGDRLPFLNRNYMFQCPKCNHKTIYSPHEKIKKGKVKILTYLLESQYNSSHPIVIHELLFVMRCKCSDENLIINDITLEPTLRILREERDFVEMGKKHSYEYYTV